MTIASDLLQQHIQTLVADNARWQTLIADIPCGYRSRPVEAVPEWLTAAEISSDPLFSPGQQVGPPVGPGCRHLARQ